MIEHEQYYRKGGTYELPIEIYNDLIEQIEDAQKERNEYKQLYENALKINQNTEKYRTELETKYVVLQQENEELNRMCELYSKSLYNAELTDYKSRCEKAIEYIEKNQERKTYYGGICDGEDYYILHNSDELLNILNGGDKK